MITAKEIMTDDVITVTEKETLENVVELLSKHQIGGLPVVDDDEKLTGIITVTDIIRYSEKIDVVPMINLHEWVSPYTDTKNLIYFRKGHEALHETRVTEVMKKKVFTVKEEDSIENVARLMKRHKINRVPVVNEENKVIGIVTRSDIVKGIGKLALT